MPISLQPSTRSNVPAGGHSPPQPDVQPGNDESARSAPDEAWAGVPEHDGGGAAASYDPLSAGTAAGEILHLLPPERRRLFRNGAKC